MRGTTPAGQRKGSAMQRPTRPNTLNFRVQQGTADQRRTLERPEDGSYLALIDWSHDPPPAAAAPAAPAAPVRHTHIPHPPAHTHTYPHTIVQTRMDASVCSFLWSASLACGLDADMRLT